MWNLESDLQATQNKPWKGSLTSLSMFKGQDVQEYLDMDLHVAPESKGSSPLLEFLSASLEALWSSLLGSSWGFQLCKNICAFVSRKTYRVRPNFLGICERCQLENILLKTRADAKPCFILVWKVGFFQPKILSGKSHKRF